MRMCGSWGKIVVDQRKCRRILKQVKQCVLPTFAPSPALIYHDFLPTSKHAHNYITRSLDSLHPNEQVYMHFNIKRVEKVVLRRKKAKVGKTHCFTCFKMRLHLRWSTTIFSQLPHMRTTISPDLWIVYIPMNRSTCILTLKESKKSC